jgi:hypothetical protein
VTFADASKNPAKPAQQRQPKTNSSLHKAKKLSFFYQTNKTLKNKNLIVKLLGSGLMFRSKKIVQI